MAVCRLTFPTCGDIAHGHASTTLRHRVAMCCGSQFAHIPKSPPELHPGCTHVDGFLLWMAKKCTPEVIPRSTTMHTNCCKQHGKQATKCAALLQENSAENVPKLHAESPTCWQRCFRFPIQKTLKVHYFKFVLLVTMDRVTEPCGDIARYMPLARVTNRVTILGRTKTTSF